MSVGHGRGPNHNAWSWPWARARARAWAWAIFMQMTHRPHPYARFFEAELISRVPRARAPRNASKTDRFDSIRLDLPSSPHPLSPYPY